MKRKIGNSWGGGAGAVIHDPSGTEIPWGWGGLHERTIRGGGDGYFLESHSHRKETKNENSEVHVKPRKRAKDSPRPIY